MSENETKKDGQQELAEDELDTVVGGVAQVGLGIVSPKSPTRAPRCPIGHARLSNAARVWRGSQRQATY